MHKYKQISGAVCRAFRHFWIIPAPCLACYRRFAPMESVRRACACLRVCKGNMSPYLHAVRDIRVIARVLEDRGPRPCFVNAPDFDRNAYRNAFGCHESFFDRLTLLHCLSSRAKKQKPCRRCCRQRRAGSRRIAATQHFCPASGIVFESHSHSPPVIKKIVTSVASLCN